MFRRLLEQFTRQGEQCMGWQRTQRIDHAFLFSKCQLCLKNISIEFSQISRMHYSTVLLLFSQVFNFACSHLNVGRDSSVSRFIFVRQERHSLSQSMPFRWVSLKLLSYGSYVALNAFVIEFCLLRTNCQIEHISTRTHKCSENVFVCVDVQLNWILFLSLCASPSLSPLWRCKTVENTKRIVALHEYVCYCCCC